jgi:lipid-A-disaccharide synthase
LPGPTIFLSAAEHSGDHHAAGLLRAIRKRLPDARFLGAAGPDMQAAGCECVVDLTARASMVTGPLKNLGFYRRALRTLRNAIRDSRADIHVPVDSPALNWHLAAEAKRLRLPVMYYVAPQVWAWARWRIKKVRRLTDHVACLLPFEEDYFRSRGVNATFVGHPLFDQLPPRPAASDMPDLAGAWLNGSWRVALLPGSRPREIQNHATALLAAAEALKQRYPRATARLAVLDDRAAQTLRRTLRGRCPLPVEVGRTFDVLADSHFALAASGTVTLAVAHAGTPMVVFHRVSGLERAGLSLVGRRLIHTRFLCLVNILAGRGIVPEIMPWHGRVKDLTHAMFDSLADLGYLESTRRNLLDLASTLPAPPHTSAADNTAQLVLDLLQP